jgi:prophage regulatory protein
VSARQFYLDKAAVAEAVALSESTVEKLVRENEFPKPRILSGRRVAWLVREVEEWAEARPVSDLLPPENTGSRRKVSAGAPTVQASHQAS